MEIGRHDRSVYRVSRDVQAKNLARWCLGGRLSSIPEIFRGAPQCVPLQLATSELPSADMRGTATPYIRSIAESTADQVFNLASMKQSLTGATLTQVKMAMALAWRHMMRLRYEEALALAEQTEPLLGDLAAEFAIPFRNEMAILRAVGLSFQDDNPAALRVAVAALKQDGGFSKSCIARTICRLAYWKLGDPDSARAVTRHHDDRDKGRLAAMCAIYDLSIDAAMELEQLRFSVAKRLALEALAATGNISVKDRVVDAFPSSLVARVLYEEGALDDAETILCRLVQGIRDRGAIESALFAYSLLAKIAVARLDYDRALSILNEAETLGETRAWPRLIAASLMEQVDIFVDRAALRPAIVCLNRMELLSGKKNVCSAMTRNCTLARSRIVLAQKPSRSDVATLRQLHHVAASGRDLYTAVQVVIRLVPALMAVGEQDEARAIFTRTLALGEAVGLCQTFVDGGPEIGVLLGEVADASTKASVEYAQLLPYARGLLMRRRARETEIRPWRQVSRSNNILSGRECNILALMGQGYSNKEIALRLGIAPETVKSHAKHVFIKLTVKTRAEAVIRASRLGLI